VPYSDLNDIVWRYLEAYPRELEVPGFTEPLSTDEAIFGRGPIGSLDLSRASGIGGLKRSHVDVEKR